MRLPIDMPGKGKLSKESANVEKTQLLLCFEAETRIKALFFFIYLHAKFMALAPGLAGRLARGTYSTSLSTSSPAFGAGAGASKTGAGSGAGAGASAGGGAAGALLAGPSWNVAVPRSIKSESSRSESVPPPSSTCPQTVERGQQQI